MRLCLAGLAVLLFDAGCGGGTTNTPRDGGPDPVAVDCVEPTGIGTTHGGALPQPETWTAAASPHVIPSDTTISAQITLEPCAVVAIGSRKTITVGTNGSIIAQGTERKPVTIRQKDSGQSWASIRAIGGTLSFTYTRVLGGGDPLNIVPDVAAALDIRADQYRPPAEILHADHVVIQDSLSQGIYLHEGGAFSARSASVVIERSRGYPIHAWSNLVGSIPQGTYTGNSKDEIVINGESAYATIDRDVTFHDRGIPYRVGSSLSLGQLRVGTLGTPPLATLTIEPGVTLRFKKGGVFHVEVGVGPNPATGALIAVGTLANPIVFTSAESSPAAGDWLGIYFGLTPNPRDRLDFVRVEYAGGASTLAGSSCPYPANPPQTNDAAIRVFGAPPATLITNTTISDSAGHGIDRGWRSDTKPSFLGGNNTFIRFARCKETYPSDFSGQCPTNPPCLR
jgi:hypothetical protein